MKISCPRCRYSGEFTVVQSIMVTVDIDADGNQLHGADFANEGHGRWINCRECGASWATKRRLDLTVDVR